MKNPHRIWKKAKNTLRTACFLSALVLLLVSCGKPGTENSLGTGSDASDSSQENTEYVIQSSAKLEFSGTPSLLSAQLLQNGFCSGSASYDKENHTSLQTLSFFTDQGVEDHSIELSIVLEDASDDIQTVSNYWYVDERNNIFVASVVWSGQQSSLRYLYRFSPEGELLSTASFEKMAGRYETAGGLTVDGEGRLYLLASSGQMDAMVKSLLIFDRDLNCLAEIPMQDEIPLHLCSGRDGFVYALLKKKDESYALGKLSSDNGKVLQTFSLPADSLPGSICADTETGFYYSDNSSCWHYDLETQTSQKLFDWLEYDMLAGNVLFLHSYGDACLKAGCWDFNPSAFRSVCLVPKEQYTASADGTSQKQPGREVVLGTIFETSTMQELVLHFNQSQTEYRVTIKSSLRPGAGYNHEDILSSMERLSMDLATSNHSYDLLSLTNLDIINLIETGVLEDIKPYLEAEGGIEPEDIFPEILSAFTINDGIYFLPPVFQLNYIVGKTSLLGKSGEWNLQDVIDFAAKYPDARLFAQQYQMDIRNNLLSYGTDSLIKEENGVPVFDTKLCGELLMLLKNNPDTKFTRAKAYLLQDNEALLVQDFAYDFESIQLTKARFGEEISYMGFPSAGRSNGIYISPRIAEDNFAICHTSDVKEGAYAFIEYCLMERASTYYSGSGFPIFKKQFDEKAAYTLDSQWEKDANGNTIISPKTNEGILTSHSVYTEGPNDDWSYESVAITQEDVDLVKKLIERGGHYYNDVWNGPIYEIFEEESAPYLAGQKSLEDTVDVISSRMMIYYSETHE